MYYLYIAITLTHLGTTPIHTWKINGDYPNYNSCRSAAMHLKLKRNQYECIKVDQHSKRYSKD